MTADPGRASPRSEGRLPEAYKDLHVGQLASERDFNQYSARKIITGILPILKPKSILDVGCGLGTWLAVFRELGVDDVHGVEGAWLEEALLEVPAACVTRVNLEEPFDFKRKFDLVMSIEVAEHLSAGAADGFVRSLTRHGNVVLFSAAIPGQGGVHHVNEQWQSYWVERFHRHGYECVDFLRPQLWDDPYIHTWLKQNLLLFCERDHLAAEPALSRLHALQQTRVMPLNVVYPTLFEAATQRLDQFLKFFGEGGYFSATKLANGELTFERRRGEDEAAQRLKQLEEFLSKGGLFRVAVDPNGQPSVSRVGESET